VNYFPGLASNHHPLGLCLPCSRFWERVSLCNQGWLQTLDPPASASRAGVSGMYHHTQQFVSFLLPQRIEPRTLYMLGSARPLSYISSHWTKLLGFWVFLQCRKVGVSWIRTQDLKHISSPTFSTYPGFVEAHSIVSQGAHVI
jgi:hypothetical protein